MASGGAGIVFGDIAHVTVSDTDNLGRPVAPFNQQRIWFVLEPFQSALITINPQFDGIFFTGSNLGGHQHAFRAIFETQQSSSIIIQESAWNEYIQFGAQLYSFQSCHIFSQMVRVCSDITHGTRFTRSFRICAPGGLGIAGIFQFGGEPALGIFNKYLSDFTKITTPNTFTGLFDSGVAGIGVRKCKNQSGFVQFGFQFQRLIKRKGDGFVNHDMKSTIQGHHGRIEMGEIWRHDGNKVHPFSFRKQGLLFKHLPVGTVDPALRQIIG